jgi:hypothetical protein
VSSFDYPIAAIPHDTPKTPQGMWVLPGTYQARLTVGGRAYRQAVVVKMDPRVKTLPADLQVQWKRSKAVDDGLRQAAAALADLTHRLMGASDADKAATQKVIDALNTATTPLPDLLAQLQVAPARPTDAADASVTAALAALDAALAQYKVLK